MSFTEHEIEVLPGGKILTEGLATLWGVKPATIHQQIWAGKLPIKSTKLGRRRIFDLRAAIEVRDGEASASNS